MGLKERPKRTFVRLKDGKFYKSTDKEYTTPYTELEGRIIGIDIKTETYNNNPLEKLYLEIDGGDDTYSLGIPFDSTYTTKLLSFLKNADITRPLSLHPSLKKDGDKEVRTIFVQQDEEYLKSAYPKGNKEVPQMKKLKSGKWFKEDFLDFFRELVLKEFKPKVAEAKTALPVGGEIEDPESEAGEDAGEMPF